MFLSLHTHRQKPPADPFSHLQALKLALTNFTESLLPRTHPESCPKVLLGHLPSLSIFPHFPHSLRPPSQEPPAWVLLSGCPWGLGTPSHRPLFSQGDIPHRQSVPAPSRSSAVSEKR